MNLFDAVVLGCFLVAGIVGLWLGVVRVVLGATSLAAGATISIRLADPFAELLVDILPSPRIALMTAFVAVYTLVLIVFGVVAWLLRASLKQLGLRWIDRMVGASVGLGVAFVLTSATSFALETRLPDTEFVGDSVTVAPLATAAQFCLERLPEAWQARMRALVGPAVVAPRESARTMGTTVLVAHSFRDSRYPGRD